MFLECKLALTFFTGCLKVLNIALTSAEREKHNLGMPSKRTLKDGIKE